MGRLSKGILGNFTGTVGTVVGSSWRSIEYIKSRSKARSKAITEKQLQQQEKFKLVLAFLQTMRDLLEVGYKHQARNMTPLNRALGHIIKTAVGGQYPDYLVAYPLVEISRGSLPNAKLPQVLAGAAGDVVFNWTDNTGMGKAKATDMAILVAYCPDLQKTIYLINPERSAATGTLDVPEFSGYAVLTWISFISIDHKEVATSIFTGEVNVL